VSDLVKQGIRSITTAEEGHKFIEIADEAIQARLAALRAIQKAEGSEKRYLEHLAETQRLSVVTIEAVIRTGELLAADEHRGGKSDRSSRGGSSNPLPEDIDKKRSYMYQALKKNEDKVRMLVNDALAGEGIPMWRAILAKILKKKREEPADLPEGIFDVIMADPPWSYDQAASLKTQIETGHYFTLNVQEIIEYQDKSGKLITDLFAENAVLFLWATNPKLRQALEVMEGWSFVYKTNACWNKIKHTYGKMGYWFLGQHELLLVGIKGKFSPPLAEKRLPSLFTEERRKHSQKPDWAAEMIEYYFPDHKWLSLFERTERAGWMSWGTEIKNA